jgi:hypothetical protein
LDALRYLEQREYFFVGYNFRHIWDSLTIRENEVEISKKIWMSFALSAIYSGIAKDVMKLQRTAENMRFPQAGEVSLKMGNQTPIVGT